MKRKKLNGVWADAVQEFEQSFAFDIIGYYYSRKCMGEEIDREAVLKEAAAECPAVVDLELEPYAITLRTGQGNLKILYRSKGVQIGHTYTIVS